MFHRTAATVAVVTAASITGRSGLSAACQRPNPLSRLRIQTFSSLRCGNREQPRRVLQPQSVGCVASRRQFHPVVLLLGKQVAKLFAILTGRAFRKWWANLPADKRAFFAEKIRRHSKGIAFTGTLLLGAAGAYYATHLEATPLTERRRFMAFNDDEMQKLNSFSGELQFEAVKDSLLPGSHPDVRRVSRVTERLLKANNDIEEVFSKQWSVSVVNSPLSNATVSPGGQIIVFGGMLHTCDNDDQLGCVLAHEVAHAILNHGVEMMSYVHLLDMFVIVMLAAIWAVMPTELVAAAMHWCFNRLCSLVLQLPYSRLLEAEADAVGLKLAAKACFDVRESSAFWSKMSIIKELGGEEPLPEFLSTHPDDARRSETLDAMMDDAIRRRAECRCPPLPRADPRNTIEGLRHQVYAARKMRESFAREGVLPIPLSRG